MNYLLTILLIIYLTGCAAIAKPAPDEGSIFFRAPEGSKLILRQQVSIPSGQSQIYFQDGRAVIWHEVNEYLPHCTLKVDSRKDTTQIIEPDEFVIRKWYNKTFFQQISIPDKSAVIQPVTGPPAAAAVDLDPDGGMDYEVVAIVMVLVSTRQPQVDALICADWGIPQNRQYITMNKIRESVGEYFRFEMAPTGE